MKPCPHKTLTLLAPQSKKVRCRTCHLVIAEDDLPGEYCPECYDVDGVKRTDFEQVTPDDTKPVRYRCDSCGAIIEC